MASTLPRYVRCGCASGEPRLRRCKGWLESLPTASWTLTVFQVSHATDFTSGETRTFRERSRECHAGVPPTVRGRSADEGPERPGAVFQTCDSVRNLRVAVVP